MHCTNFGEPATAFAGAVPNAFALKNPVPARRPPDFVRDRALRAVARHWRSLLRDGGLPERRALDPAQMIEALPYLWLCAKEAPGRYRMLLAGAEINRLLGAPLRGRILADVLDKADWRALEEKLEQVLGTPALHWSTGPVFAAEPRDPHGECLMMPLEEGGEPVIVLAATTYNVLFVRSRGRLCPVQTTRVVPLRDL